MDKVDDINLEINKVDNQIKTLNERRDYLTNKRNEIINADKQKEKQRVSMFKVGDVVKFKNADVVVEAAKDFCGWSPEMNYLCGQTRVITRAILERIKNSWNNVIWEEHHINEKGKHETWYISSNMIELVE